MGDQREAAGKEDGVQVGDCSGEEAEDFGFGIREDGMIGQVT